MEKSTAVLVLVAHPSEETTGFSSVCAGADVVSRPWPARPGRGLPSAPSTCARSPMTNRFGWPGTVRSGVTFTRPMGSSSARCAGPGSCREGRISPQRPTTPCGRAGVRQRRGAAHGALPYVADRCAPVYGNPQLPQGRFSFGGELGGAGRQQALGVLNQDDPRLRRVGSAEVPLQCGLG
jgi:hypothetical protein